MTRTSLFWAFIALVGLSGCGNLVQDVSIDKVPAAQPKLIVQAFISPQDTVLAVYVDQPTSVLGAYNYPTSSYRQRLAIQNAIVDISDGARTVRLSKRNLLVPPATVSPELYYGVSTKEFPVVVGRTYTLTASAPGYPAITAQCTVPAVVLPAEIRLDSTVNTQYGQEMHTYTSELSWQDPAGQPNYYRVTGVASLAVLYRFSTSPTTPPRDSVGIQERRLIINGDSERSDQNRDGQRLNATASLTTFTNNRERPQLFSLTLSNLEAGLYQYLEGVRRQRQQGENPFSEPVLIPSNIQNGLGYFGAFNQATLTINAK